MLDCRATFATSLLPAREAPLPISATFNAASEILIVTFDQPIIPGILDTLNWRVRVSNQGYDPTTSIATDSIVTSILAPPDPDIGADVCRYAPPPFDVIGQNALPAPAFADFPVTVI